MVEKLKISVPTNFDFRIIKRLRGLIYDTYGSLDLIGESAIPAYALPRVSFRKFEYYVRCSHDNGIKFNYVINHPQVALNKSTFSLLDRLSQIKVDLVIVSNPRLITYIKNNYNFSICSSIFCRIDTLEKAEEYNKLGCDIICIDFSRNHDFEFIKKIKDSVKVGVKLLANNACLSDCPYREEHLNRGGYLCKVLIKCLKLKLLDPDLILQSGFIFPQDLEKYEEAGVDFIKLGGRPMPTWWIIDCASAYCSDRYADNAFRLMNVFGSEHRMPYMAGNLVSLIPASAFRLSFKLLYRLTSRMVFKQLSQEENIKPILRLRMIRDIFRIRGNSIEINNQRKNYLLREIDKILGKENRGALEEGGRDEENTLSSRRGIGNEQAGICASAKQD